MRKIKNYELFINENISINNLPSISIEKLKTLINRNNKKLFIVTSEIESFNDKLSNISRELNKDLIKFNVSKNDTESLYTKKYNNITAGYSLPEKGNYILYFEFKEYNPPELINAVFSLILKGELGNYILPDDCAIVCSLKDENTNIPTPLFNKTLAFYLNDD